MREIYCRMRPLIAPLISALLFCSCSFTRLSDPHTGKTILFTHANMASLDVTAPGITLHAKGIDHSGATLAGGTAFAQGTNAVAGGIVGATLAAGSSGLFGPSVSTTKSLILPAAAAASPLVSKPATPKATPVPSAASIWPSKP